MLIENPKKNILQLAADALTKQTGVGVTLNKSTAGKQTIALKNYEVAIKLKCILVAAGTEALTTAIEFCKRMQNLTQTALITFQIAPEMTELLRGSGIQFIDTAVRYFGIPKWNVNC